MINAIWRSSGGSLGPREVDELFIWEIGVMLGQAHELGDTTNDSKDEDTSSSTASFQQRSRAYLRKRMAYAKGKGPKPEAAAIDADTFKSMTGALRDGGTG